MSGVVIESGQSGANEWFHELGEVPDRMIANLEADLVSHKEVLWRQEQLQLVRHLQNYIDMVTAQTKKLSCGNRAGKWSDASKTGHVMTAQCKIVDPGMANLGL